MLLSNMSQMLVSDCHTVGLLTMATLRFEKGCQYHRTKYSAQTLLYWSHWFRALRQELSAEVLPPPAWSFHGSTPGSQLWIRLTVALCECAMGRSSLCGIFRRFTSDKLRTRNDGEWKRSRGALNEAGATSKRSLPNYDEGGRRAECVRMFPSRPCSRRAATLARAPSPGAAAAGA